MRIALDAQARSTRTSDHGLLPNGEVDPALVPSSAEIAQMLGLRTNAENRAWSVIEEWRAFILSKGDAGVFEIVIKPPVSKDDWDAEIWRSRWYAKRDELRRDVVISKRGTSRVDALAHLASWCQAETGHAGDCPGCPTCEPNE